MPIYLFQCKNEECGQEYEELTSYDETEKYESVECPHCQSKAKEKLIARSFNFAFAQPEGTDRWNSDSTGHDYRYKHKQPGVREQRQRATAASKMGASPYNPIDDVSSGKYFGEVK